MAMDNCMDVGHIQAGDVLLFHGNSFVSWAIRKIDGSEVNHAAIALGGGQLAEAGGSGLTRRGLPTSFTDKDYMLVRRLLDGAPLAPVVDTADAYLVNGNFYAYQQIVLLAVLGLTRRIPLNGLTKRLVRSACDHAARALMDLLPIGASWMICSEYVYRCYDEAIKGEPDPYRVRIRGIDFGGALVEEGGTWADVVQGRAHDLALSGSVSFGDLPFDEAAAEADLAPLIAALAATDGLGHAGPVPDGPVTASFELDQEEATALEPDDGFDETVVQFAEMLKVVRTSTPGIAASFGLLPVGIAGAAVKGAISGLKDLTVDPNFVTPRDLLQSDSLSPAFRAQ